MRFRRLMNYVGVEGVSLNQFVKHEDVEVIPAYMLVRWIEEGCC